jgi:hypothetical protein
VPPCGNLKRQIEHMPPQVFGTDNLEDPNYCRLLFGARPMHEAFATHDSNAVRTAAAAMLRSLQHFELL